MLASSDPPAFLCDRMLVRLGRWLRAAGYDTAIVSDDHNDRDIVVRAHRENRLLLTCDRRLKRERAADDASVMVLDAAGTEAAVADLTRRLRLDWGLAPFTRCLEDNTPLRPATEDERATIPEKAGALSGPFNACPACGKLYWPGSHVRRMRRRLARWQGIAQTPAPPK